jgi:hypothetical protein
MAEVRLYKSIGFARKRAFNLALTGQAASMAFHASVRSEEPLYIAP